MLPVTGKVSDTTKNLQTQGATAPGSYLWPGPLIREDPLVNSMNTRMRDVSRRS